MSSLPKRPTLNQSEQPQAPEQSNGNVDSRESTPSLSGVNAKLSHVQLVLQVPRATMTHLALRLPVA